MRRVGVRLKGGIRYDIEIGSGALDALGETARGTLPPHARRLAVVSNERVFALYGGRAVVSLRAGGYEVLHWLLGEGERHKSLRNVERAAEFLTAAGLERGDAVVALGGGVVGDLAGFLAATYMRGVAFMQVPTTLLAQIDSSVGGKTGVNTRAGKNMIGAFHQPRAVVIDTDTLRTLPPRELTAGWCEALKQGAVGSRALFERTRRFLAGAWAAKFEGGAEPNDPRGAAGRRTDEPAGRVVTSGEQLVVREDELADLIAAQCAFKAKVVARDEREEIGRADRLSRRLLNFGHTVGHALETATNYRRFRHGEAVGCGMLVAGEISKSLGLLAASELESLRRAVRLAGRLPRADDLDPDMIIRLLAADKKSVAGRIRWVLLERIGRGRVVGGEHVPARLVRESLRAALRP